MVNQEVMALRELSQSLIQDLQFWKGMLALVLRQEGSSYILSKSKSEVEMPYEIVLRRVDEAGTPDSVEMELKLLEGKEEIEAVLGKPSPIIIPR